MKFFTRAAVAISLLLCVVACRTETHAEKTYSFHSPSFPNAPKSAVDLPSNWKAWDDYATTAGHVGEAHEGAKAFVSDKGGDYPPRFFWSVYQCTTDCDDLQAVVQRLGKSQLGRLAGYSQSKQEDATAKNAGSDISSRIVGNFTDPATGVGATGIWTYLVKKSGADVYLYVVETDAKQSDFAKIEDAFGRIHDSIKIG